VDKQQFHNITSQAKEELGVDSITAIEDKGYYSASEFAKCKEDNILQLYLRQTIPIWQQARGMENRVLNMMKKRMGISVHKDIFYFPTNQKRKMLNTQGLRDIKINKHAHNVR
jgi:hypothetical protein